LKKLAQDGLSTLEIGTELGISASTVSRLLRKAA
jgi:DNA-directed RNA polymerase specialized sigma subunit